jgi:hypothetical protein
MVYDAVTSLLAAVPARDDDRTGHHAATEAKQI